MGPGATVGVLGTGVPRLACLRPAAWLEGGPAQPIFINTSSRPSQGGRQGASSGTASSGWLTRRRRVQGGVPREGPMTQAMTTKGAKNDHLEGEHLVHLILTKVGLRQPKTLVITPPWAPRRPPSCRSAGLGPVAPKWMPLLDALACACSPCTKEERRTLRGLAPLVVMACVMGTSRGTPP